MLSSYVLLKAELRKGLHSVNIFHNIESKNKSIMGEGFEFIWKCQNINSLTPLYESLLKWKQSIKWLPVTLNISKEFMTTSQIGRYE